MRIKIKLHPNSSKEEVKEISMNNYEIWIKEKPIDNKANIHVEKLLKKYFGKSVKIVRGLKSREKIINVE